MKKKYLFSLAMAGLLLGACSSDDVVVSTGEGQGPQWDANGNGYVSLAINLPTKSAATKAFNEGSNLDDGTPEEYDVKNATLILFKGADKGKATVVNAYSLPLKWGAGNPNQITTTAKIVQKINSISMGDGEKLYALVVLNHNDVFKVTPNAGLQVKDDADVFTGTLDALNLKVAANEATGDWHKNGFLMANAPLANKAGGSTTAAPTDAEILTLMEIDPAKIKDSYDAAEANPAANIFVERAVAKVTLEGKNGFLSQGTSEEYEILGWDIDNTNTKSNLVRSVGTHGWVAYQNNLDNTTGYRFLGNTSVGTTVDALSLYRTYWGEDVNYSNTNKGELQTVGGHTISQGNLKVADGETPDYCLENTTDVLSMTEENSTRVIVAAQFNDGNDFYILNDDRDVMWAAEASVKTEILRVFMNQSTVGVAWIKEHLKKVATGTTPHKAEASDFIVTLAPQTDGNDFYILNDDRDVMWAAEASVKTEILRVFMNQSTVGVAWIKEHLKKVATGTTPHKAEASDFIVTLAPQTEGQTAGLQKFTIKLNHTDESVKDKYVENAEVSEECNTDVNGRIKVDRYENGVAYYPVYIKHFGDDETPWNVGEQTPPAVGNIYPAPADQNYLGRYGVLRNNWYDISVTGIKDIGSSTVDPVTGETIDKLESYISVKINILAWAKRSQSVEL